MALQLARHHTETAHRSAMGVPRGLLYFGHGRGSTCAFEFTRVRYNDIDALTAIDDSVAACSSNQ